MGNDRTSLFDEFQFSARRRELRRDGGVVQLGSRAAGILAYLLDHAGQTIGKDALMAAVWPDRVVAEHNIAVHLSALRRALGEGAGGVRYIHTDPGRGYRFVAAVAQIEDAPPPFETPAPRKPGSDRPASAALPFDSMSQDPIRGGFADGMAAESIRLPGVAGDSPGPIAADARPIRSGAPADPDAVVVAPAEPSPPTPTIGVFGGVPMLAGCFAAYSKSWSPFYAGQFVRGSLRLREARGGGLSAIYHETLTGHPTRMTGDAMISGRSIHLHLREASSDLPLFVSLHLPGSPALVLCGLLSGSAFVSHDPLPSASRIVFVRVPDGPKLDASNRYFEPAAGAIAADLVSLGFPLLETNELDAAVLTFLRHPVDQVTPHNQARFATMLGRDYLHATATQPATGEPPAHDEPAPQVR